MITFPMQTLPNIEQLQTQLCESAITESATRSLRVILNLSCVDDCYSVGSLADCIRAEDFGFSVTTDFVRKH